ncbi:hypothetical protein RYX56_11955 [Alkalihalophilus lindianensis]|uniref:Gram-positive cocci surface proteins LPxTG domain-containing protein n=1 Tax=Alkalihalophilus lindianensis TaxID=1630542 RepID=A0ABU3XB27_9BACI|nr:hypothetical protein [Alkalihalophilus lindianensis]MDV2685086.1 hypothetical protein [Alkalihalophilus lindianensis]
MRELILSDMSLDAMPATGMGGISTTTRVLLILFAGALAFGAALFFLNFRRKQEA